MPTKTHNMSYSPEYYTWQSMRQRCENPNNCNYSKYGARGIKVCARWAKFENFFEDMGLRPEGLSLDRVDNDGDYSPENCKWSTAEEQVSNRRYNNIIEYEGKKQTLTRWCKELRFGTDTYYRARRKGLTDQQIFDIKRKDNK